MPTIFKNIRRKLAEEKKVTSYLRYAVGEILLVVIGILIALQVNSWHQQQLDQREAENIKTNLHEEFTENRALLITSRNEFKKSIASGLVLINLVGASRSELGKHNLDSLFYFTFESASYLPSDNSLQDILQSGRLHLISNKALRENLLFWTASMKRLKNTDDTSEGWVTNHMIPYLLPYMSLREMDRYGKNQGRGESRLHADYYPLFQKLEFENELDEFLYLQQSEIDLLNAIEKTQGKIIEHTAN
ncbi:MAG TPA: hypothetical protein VJ964_14725 [Balneolaceae bacterium]|nr:hypothetical protein [Balneolaceae bacterium]